MKINEEIEKTLGSLDQISRVNAPSGFSEELFQKVSFVRQSNDVWYHRLKYGIAAMIVITLLNGYILTKSDLLYESQETPIESLAEDWYDGSDLIEYNYEIE